jgi:xylose isomerase
MENSGFAAATLRRQCKISYLIIKIKNKKLFQDYCKTFDSCLVEFDDAAENNILKSFLKSKYQHHKTGVGHSIVQGRVTSVA